MLCMSVLDSIKRCEEVGGFDGRQASVIRAAGLLKRDMVPSSNSFETQDIAGNLGPLHAGIAKQSSSHNLRHTFNLAVCAILHSVAVLPAWYFEFKWYICSVATNLQMVFLQLGCLSMSNVGAQAKFCMDTSVRPVYSLYFARQPANCNAT